MPTPITEMPESTEPGLEGQIVGEYVVQARLGRGAFGTVYKGVHPLIGKVVAIKVLSRRFSADPEMVSRFVAEARAVNQIRHRHIIDIFSFGQLEDGRHYYVMEYLEGETLQALLAREHRVPLARCVTILQAIGRALDAAHAKGIAHCDLKAENIFLGTDSDGGVWPKLLDFGIAKLINAEDGLAHKTRYGMSLGTPFYMSPEQCHGRQVDHRTDIYAFGVLVYLMLTGVFPFDGGSHLEILVKQISAAPVPPSARVAELPESIDDVVLWLLHKDPAQRPSDLKTAVMALEQAAWQAGLITPAAWIRAWDATAGQARTQSTAAVPAGVRAPGHAFATTRQLAPVMPRGAPKLGRGSHGSGRAAGRVVAAATVDVSPSRGASGGHRGSGRSGKAPVLAVASLVALTVVVAAAVALYPRSDDPAARIATQRASSPVPPRAGQGREGQASPQPHGLSPEHLPRLPGPALQVPGSALQVPGPALQVPGPALQVPRAAPGAAQSSPADDAAGAGMPGRF